MINNIPATIRPAASTGNNSIAASLKRSNTSIIDTSKNKKFALQTIATPVSKLQWSQTIGGSGGTTITASPIKKTTAATTLNVDGLMQAVTGNASTVSPLSTTLRGLRALSGATSTVGNTALQLRRPTFLIKSAEAPKRTIRSITLELIERAPLKHLGISPSYLPILKGIICNTANVKLCDCYMTLKKIRLNEDFAVLADYFEINENEVQQVFARTLVKLSRFMHVFLRWSHSKKYYDRRKAQPFAYRAQLLHVQSLTDCVETDMLRQYANIEKYKYLMSMSLNGLISYTSKVFTGHHDDLSIFKAANFQNDIPKYLSLVVVPGKGIRRCKRSQLLKQSGRNKTTNASEQEHDDDADNDSGTADTDSSTDSAEETNSQDIINGNIYGISLYRKYANKRAEANLSNYQPMHVLDNELRSNAAKDLSIPVMQVSENALREKIRCTVNRLREFRVLQHCAIREPIMYQYLNEILLVAAALTNLCENERRQ